MPSAEFQTLTSRVHDLKHILPPATGVAGAHTQDENDNIVAFAILVAAAIEHYLERRALQVAEDAVNNLKVTGKIGRVVKFLAVMAWIQFPKDTKDVSAIAKTLGVDGFRISVTKSYAQTQSPEFQALAERALVKFRNVVRQNHGITSKHRMALLVRIGFDVPNMDPTLRSRLDQIAALRNEGAHSMQVQAINIPDVTLMESRVNDALRLLNDLDKSMTRLTCRVH